MGSKMFLVHYFDWNSDDFMVIFFSLFSNKDIQLPTPGISCWLLVFLFVGSRKLPLKYLSNQKKTNLKWFVCLVCFIPDSETILIVLYLSKIMRLKFSHDYGKRKILVISFPARFSPDDKYSRNRVMLKKRFGILPTQQPMPVYWNLSEGDIWSHQQIE